MASRWRRMNLQSIEVFQRPLQRCRHRRRLLLHGSRNSTESCRLLRVASPLLKQFVLNRCLLHRCFPRPLSLDRRGHSNRASSFSLSAPRISDTPQRRHDHPDVRPSLSTLNAQSSARLTLPFHMDGNDLYKISWRLIPVDRGGYTGLGNIIQLGFFSVGDGARQADIGYMYTWVWFTYQF